MDAMIQVLFAVQSAAAPAGRSSMLGRVIIVLCLAAGIVFALRGAFKHFKGGGGCCGGGSEPPPQQDEKRIGKVVATRTLVLDGMHCMNCVSRVRRALDAIDGVSSDVSLDPQRAVVRMDREIDDATLKEAVENQGFTVVSVS